VEDYLLLEMGLLGGYFVEEEKNDRKSPICTGKKRDSCLHIFSQTNQLVGTGA